MKHFGKISTNLFEIFPHRADSGFQENILNDIKSVETLASIMILKVLILVLRKLKHKNVEKQYFRFLFRKFEKYIKSSLKF